MANGVNGADCANGMIPQSDNRQTLRCEDIEGSIAEHLTRCRHGLRDPDATLDASSLTRFRATGRSATCTRRTPCTPFIHRCERQSRVYSEIANPPWQRPFHPQRNPIRWEFQWGTIGPALHQILSVRIYKTPSNDCTILTPHFFSHHPPPSPQTLQNGCVQRPRVPPHRSVALPSHLVHSSLTNA